ncbi:MAG: hypothetical protein ACKPJJ_34045, partial [Planctomycetaceae bacterium]
MKWHVVALSESIETIRRTASRLNQPVILESTLADPASSRWSIFAAEPLETLTVRQDHAVLQTEKSSRAIRIAPRWGTKKADELSAELVLKFWIDRWLGGIDAADCPLSAPFKGGVLGWLGYDFGWHLEKLPRLIPDRDGWEDLRLGVYDTFIVYDHKYNHA